MAEMVCAGLCTVYKKRKRESPSMMCRLFLTRGETYAVTDEGLGPLGG